MKAAPSHCFVFREHLPVEETLRSISLILQEVGREIGTAFMRTARTERENAIDYTWMDAAPSTPPSRVVWCEDGGIPAQYVEVSSGNPMVLAAVEERVKHVFSISTPEELRDQVDKKIDADPGAITRLALATRGPFNEGVVRRVAAALGHLDPAVRQQAQMAAFLLKWEELRGPIAEALETETVAELRPGLEFLAHQPFESEPPTAGGN